MIKTIIEKFILIIALYFVAQGMAFSCQNGSWDDYEFPPIPNHMIVWIHVGNSDTSAVINNFKKESGNVKIKEILSLDELKRFINFVEPQKISAVVTEMGFWEDDLHYRFNKTAGVTAMEKINEKLSHLKGKFVISARVGRNEDLLLDISNAHFFRHITMFSPINDLFPCVSVREKELDLCLKTLRNSLFSKPVYCKGVAQEDFYPINHFEIEKIFDVEHEANAREFLNKHAQFIQEGIPSEWEWGFHGSSCKDTTYNIAKINFSIQYLGQNSGNRGAYGEGIYFSRRGYLPMYVSILREHFLILACKVLKGRAQENVKHLSEADYTRGVKIPKEFNSNISENGLEIVIDQPSQILPSFIIGFSIPYLQLELRPESETHPRWRGLDRLKAFCNGKCLDDYI